MRTCETCTFFRRETGACGPYDMPAQAARRDDMLCGPAAEEWDPAGPLLPWWGWAVIVVLATFVAYMNAASILTLWQWVRS